MKVDESVYRGDNVMKALDAVTYSIERRGHRATRSVGWMRALCSRWR